MDLAYVRTVHKSVKYMQVSGTAVYVHASQNAHIRGAFCISNAHFKLQTAFLMSQKENFLELGAFFQLSVRIPKNYCPPSRKSRFYKTSLKMHPTISLSTISHKYCLV